MFFFGIISPLLLDSVAITTLFIHNFAIFINTSLILICTMAEFKLVISDPKTGKSVQKEVKDETASVLLGLRLTDKVNGNDIGFTDYEFEIRGGSDFCGFPMRKGLPGTRRKVLLIGKGVGCSGKERKLRKKTKPRKRHGYRRKKTVCPETIHEQISQINLKVLKAGKDSLFETKEEPAKE